VPDEVALSQAERAELERLRAEAAASPQAETGNETAAPPRRQRWRSVVASLLIVLGCILAPLSVVAVWTRNLVTDTDRYVATVAPLASDPAIQDAVANRVTAQIVSRLDVSGIVNQTVDSLADRGLPPVLATRLQSLSTPVAEGVEGFVGTKVDEIVASDDFADVWVSANRAAHSALVAALTGEGDGAISIENDTVSLDLGPFISIVKQRLVDSGFELASRIPEIDTSFVLFQSDAIVLVQDALRLLNAVGNWLPVLVLALLGLGVYVAKGHRRALVGVGLGLAAGMLAVALALAGFRTLYLNGLPPEVSRDAAAVFYDTLTRFLRTGLRTVFVLGLVVAIAGFFTGRSATAVRSRAGIKSAIGWLRGGTEKAGLGTGPVGAWVYANKRPLHIGATAAAGLVLILWDQPTGKVIIGLALILVAVLAIIEFLGRPPAGRPAAVETSKTESAGAL